LAKLGLTQGISASYLGQALVVGGHFTNPPADFLLRSVVGWLMSWCVPKLSYFWLDRPG